MDTGDDNDDGDLLPAPGLVCRCGEENFVYDTAGYTGTGLLLCLSCGAQTTPPPDYEP